MLVFYNPFAYLGHFFYWFLCAALDPVDQHNCIIPFVREHSGDALSLYTNSEINRKFYTKNGFKEFNEQLFTYRGKNLGSWSYIMPLDEQI